VLVLWCVRIKWLDKIREMLLRNTNRDLSIQGCIEPDRVVRGREPEALNASRRRKTSDGLVVQSKDMRVQCKRGNQLKLLSKEVAERLNVGDIDKEYLLDRRTGRANYVERIIMIRSRFIIRKDEDDLSLVEEGVSCARHGVSPADHADLLTPGGHAAREMGHSVEQLSQTITPT
jgi:hypothetical protein